MSAEIEKNPLNVAGRYYVDCATCIAHDLCVEVAPNNFRKDENYSAYVFKQPVNPEEEAQCRLAVADCPVAAIHDNGDI
jgi:ferredoxin